MSVVGWALWHGPPRSLWWVGRSGMVLLDLYGGSGVLWGGLPGALGWVGHSGMVLLDLHGDFNSSGDTLGSSLGALWWVGGSWDSLGWSSWDSVVMLIALETLWDGLPRALW